MQGMETTQTTTHYEWRERVDGRLLTPCSDPRIHETPFDYLFDTVDEAIAALGELYAPYDSATWVLVHCTETIVDMTAEMPVLLKMETDAAIRNVYETNGKSGVWEWVKENRPEWSVGYCPACEDHVYAQPEDGYDCCSVCWEVL